MTRNEYLTGGAYIVAKRGNDLPQAKLNADLVRAIRLNVHVETARQWAIRLGVHQRTIDKVRDRRSWGHI